MTHDELTLTAIIAAAESIDDPIGHTSQIAMLIRALAAHVASLPAPEKGEKGDKGDTGLGINDLTPAGRQRVKLMVVYDILANLELDAKSEGLSSFGRTSIKKARRLIKKAIGTTAAEDETQGGKLLRNAQDARAKTKKEQKKLRRTEEDDDEDDDNDDDEDEEP